MVGLPMIAQMTAWFALGVIAAIGISLLLTKARRREDGVRSERIAPEGVDPINLRKRRPTTGRLTGAVLVTAVLVLVVVLRRPLGLG